jgi:uncharacterized protein YcfJ
MNNWVLGFDGFIGALTGEGNALRNTGRGRSVDADSGTAGGGYIDIEVEDGLVIQMRKVKHCAEEDGGLDEL